MLSNYSISKEVAARRNYVNLNSRQIVPGSKLDDLAAFLKLNLLANDKKII
jgi:hypothetical protein